jgi:N-acetylglucosamine-6-phosphate deacetylase
LFHTHGLGPFDFSALDEASLPALDRLAASRKALLCSIVYLTADHLDAFEELLVSYSRRKQSGKLENILGFAVEGPVLGPNGGTPKGSVWRPSAAQWRRIASWCSLGLKYVVIAPDILSLDDEVDRGFSFADLLSLIYASGGRVALGHFGESSPELSARRFEEVLGFIEGGHEPSPYLILTDHLFNDMPRAFQHAFRTPGERVQRVTQLAAHPLEPWQALTLSGLLGPVPAAMLLAARNRRLTPALNFDGGHVDLEVCRMVVEFLGADRIIAITDHTEILTLADEPLVRDEHNRLLYRSDGMLAASSVTHEEQQRNMRSIGMTPDEIGLVQYETPLAALRFEPRRRMNAPS